MLIGYDLRFWRELSAVFGNPYLADFLRAGAEFGGTTLPRFYAVHMLLVPGAIIALIGAHLYLVVKLGTTAPPWVRAEAKPKALRTEKVKSSSGNGTENGDAS